MRTFDSSMRQPDYFDQLQPSASVSPILLPKSCKSEQHPSLADYASQALNEALEAGLHLEDIKNALGAASLTKITPPERNESINDYRNRATSELLLHYLVKGISEAGSEVSAKRRGCTIASKQSH